MVKCKKSSQFLCGFAVIFSPSVSNRLLFARFGAGSEFGKDMREEARRKKLGIVSKKKSADTFPWLMKVGGKTGKK